MTACSPWCCPRSRTPSRGQSKSNNRRTVMEGYHSNDQFGDAGDLDALLYPSQAFGHPSEVVSHPDLTGNERRAILASWASDACAMHAVPTLRLLPGGRRTVLFDDGMDALRPLDE